MARDCDVVANRHPALVPLAYRHLASAIRTSKLWEYRVAMTFSLAPIAAFIAGVLILAIPRLLNYIVALYLIIIGILGLFPGLTA